MVPETAFQDAIGVPGFSLPSFSSRVSSAAGGRNGSAAEGAETTTTTTKKKKKISIDNVDDASDADRGAAVATPPLASAH